MLQLENWNRPFTTRNRSKASVSAETSDKHHHHHLQQNRLILSLLPEGFTSSWDLEVVIKIKDKQKIFISHISQ